MKYINLKNHTDYSLLEGVSKIKDYVEKAKKENIKILSIADTNMYGIMKMYNLCKKENIDLIIGMEIFTYGLIIPGEYSFTIFAKSYEGYKELIRLNKILHSKYFAKRNIIDIQNIIECENLLVIAGGLNSEIYKLINELDYSSARKLIDVYKQKFKDFYLEIPCFETYDRNLEEYVNIIKQKDIKCVATNDTYYINKEDSYLKKIVYAIKENKNLSNLEYEIPNDLYFKNEEQIRERLKKLDADIVEQAIYNTEEIARKCIFKFDFTEKKLPTLKLEISEKEALEKNAFDGLYKKYKNVEEHIIERLKYELKTIDDMGFNGYFLIVEDIVKYARENNILVGAGRGSAAGSLVAYCLDITKVDPIKYELMFERFLNKGRKNLPDIDIDFETTRKNEVIQYVMNKYGEEYVSNIVTFSTLKEKQLKRDLCRIFKCKENDKRLINIIDKLKDNVRHTSIHASGVIISKNKLEEEVPVIKDNNLNINIAQYQMEELESMGLLKMDFLSLSNLDILANVSKLTNVKIDDIELNDKKTFDMYNKGDTVGIFQVEAYGMTNLIKKYRIDKFTDISSVLALYRPGPLKSGLVDRVIETKNKGLKVNYLFKELEEILNSTYGLITYQEQVMKIAEKVAGFDLNESDDLRRAISKKKSDILKFYKTKFIENAVKNNYDRKKLEILYTQIENFCEYGFNKSHTIPYAMISYYTAYFKANYTKEYMLCLLNEQISTQNKISIYNNEMEKFNIEMLAVDINKSNVEFSIENDNIRYGLYALNNISKSIAKDIVEERNKNGNFTDIIDFVSRMLNYTFNQKHYESLVKSGALDEFNISRKELIENKNKIFEISKKILEHKSNIGKELFFAIDNQIIEYISDNIEEYTYNVKNRYEYEMTGLLLNIKNRDLVKIIKNKKCIIIDNNTIILNGVNLEIENNKNIFEYAVYINKYNLIPISEICKYKEATTNILLDNLSKEQKEKLKQHLLKNGGNSKVNFFENKKKLMSKKDTYTNINIENMQKLVEIVGITNILIKLEM